MFQTQIEAISPVFGEVEIDRTLEEQEKVRNDKLWVLMKDYLGTDIRSI
jgi:hypothetical protein